jgi:hypothetical protein
MLTRPPRREQGLRKGLLEGIAMVLNAKVGPPGRKLRPKIRGLKDVDALRALGRTIEKAETLDEVREQCK